MASLARVLLRVFTEPQQGAAYADLLRIARATEDLGFDAFFRSDHYLAMDVEGLPGPSDAWVSLAGLARDTSRIRLGTLVSPATFRFPGPLAITVAQVDDMSGGRVELGLGTGWYAAEHAAYGIPYPERSGERFELLEEQLAIVTGLWGTPVGEQFSYTGQHYRLRDSPALPKPVQRPHPPVVVGGFGPRRTPALAARYAAEFNLAFHPLDDVRTAFERVKSACADAGRDPADLHLSVGDVVLCGRDEAQVRRRAQAAGHDLAEHAEQGTGIIGTPAQVVDRIGAYAELGASRTYLQVLDLDDVDHLELLGSEVLPQV